MRFTKLALALAAAALLPAAAAGAHTPGLHTKSGSCHVRLSAEPHVVTFGESAELFGTLVCPGGPTAAAGQTVTAYQRSATTGLRLAGVTSTGAGGAFSLGTPALASDSIFYVKVATARSVKRVVRVAPLVTLAANGVSEQTSLSVTTNHRVLFTGVVSPADAGAVVFLEREAAVSNEEWAGIDRGVVRPDGSYQILHTFVRPGEANLRVVVRPNGIFDVRGISNTISMQVSQRQNPRLTIFSSADPVFFGQPVTISGTEPGADGQKVTLLGRTWNSVVFTKVQEGVTDGSGAYKFVVPSSTANTLYKVVSSTGRPVSATLFEGAKYLVTAGASASTVQAGQPVTFAGTVTPGHAGKIVYLERENQPGRGFHVVDLGIVNNEGKYTITHFMFGSGKQMYRVKVPGDPSNQTGSSSTFPVEVTPPPPGVVLHPVKEGTLPH
jgi:hypothetical protein